jgi:hypothetical protein
MFIQVIEGKVRDAEALHERISLWERDLMPGAIGYLGSTGGCTESGDCILVARFADADAARRNSRRPEQSAWWAETEKLFDGPVTFHDTTDVYVMGHDEQMDDAHFVQVMEGHVSDRARADALNDEAAPLLAEERPDLIGSVTAFHGHGDYTEVAYFTSEADAREGERKQMSPEMADRFAQFQDLWKVDRYLDITDPWLVSAGGGRY